MTTSNTNQKTLLDWAIKNGHARLARRLKSNGVAFNRATALVGALMAPQNNEEVIDLVLEWGCDLNGIVSKEVEYFSLVQEDGVEVHTHHIHPLKVSETGVGNPKILAKLILKGCKLMFGTSFYSSTEVSGLLKTLAEAREFEALDTLTQPMRLELITKYVMRERCFDLTLWAYQKGILSDKQTEEVVDYYISNPNPIALKKLKNTIDPDMFKKHMPNMLFKLSDAQLNYLFDDTDNLELVELIGENSRPEWFEEFSVMKEKRGFFARLESIADRLGFTKEEVFCFLLERNAMNHIGRKWSFDETVSRYRMYISTSAVELIHNFWDSQESLHLLEYATDEEKGFAMDKTNSVILRMNNIA